MQSIIVFFCGFLLAKLSFSIMIFEEEQKGLFTFYIEQSQQQSSPPLQLHKANLKSYKNKRASEGSEPVKYAPTKNTSRFKNRHKSESFGENADKCEKSSPFRAKQPKQKNKSQDLGYNQILNCKQVRNYKRTSNEYSNAYNLKAHLEDLITKKKIVSQKHIIQPELQTLTLKKNFSEPECMDTQLGLRFRTLRFQDIGSGMQKPAQPQKTNEKIKKRGIVMTKPKKLLKSKIKQVKPFSEMVPLVEQKQNKTNVNENHPHQGHLKKSYKRYRRINNPIKNVQQPYLQPISSHRIRPFREYLVSMEQFCGLGETNRGSHCLERPSENFSRFAAEKEVDCIKLINQLRKGHL